jgi:hypothetical protein
MLAGTVATVAPPASATNGIAALPKAHVRNPGIPLDLAWVQARFTSRGATERRAATLPTRRSVKRAWQAAWLLRAITCIDLTTLLGDDTPGNVKRLCAKARQPVRQDILSALGVPDLPLRVGAVCVYHNLVPAAVEALAGSDIPVAAVSTGFPAGQTALETKLAEIRASTEAGAREIDIVISRAHVLTANFGALYDEGRGTTLPTASRWPTSPRAPLRTSMPPSPLGLGELRDKCACVWLVQSSSIALTAASAKWSIHHWCIPPMTPLVSTEKYASTSSYSGSTSSTHRRRRYTRTCTAM